MPYTARFLRLLINNDYDEMYKNYGSSSGMSLDDFKKKMENLHAVFGKIQSYSYKGFSSSYASTFGKLTGFFMCYDVIFDNGKTFQGTFSIEIDKDTGRPKKGRIFTFDISSDFGKRSFYLRLIK